MVLADEPLTFFKEPVHSPLLQTMLSLYLKIVSSFHSQRCNLSHSVDPQPSKAGKGPLAVKIPGTSSRFRRLPKRQRGNSNGRARRPGGPLWLSGLCGTPDRRALPAKDEATDRSSSDTSFGALNPKGINLSHLAIGTLILLSGCAIIPSPPVPELEAPDQFLNADASPGASAFPTSEWFSFFESETLKELLETAQTRNHNLKAAYQSVLSSRAITRQFRSDARPQIDGSLSANSFSESATLSPDGVSDDGERFDAALSAGWELDLFGRIRKSIRSAEANAAAQEALYYGIMFTLQADVAQLYFRANSLQSEIELLEKSRDTRQKSLKLVEERFATGTVSELDVAQSETLLATAEARLFELSRIQNSLVYALGVLVGETPSTFTFNPKPLTQGPPNIPTGLPGELLTRRPDVKQAEYLLVAASEQVGVAKASFFPEVSLSGTVGYAAYNWDELFKPSSYLDNLGAQGALPFFRGGRLRARLAQNKALYEQRLEEFKQVAIEAITEVDDLLQSTRFLKMQTDSLSQAVSAAQRAREISSIQYERGLVDFITALDAERTALDIEQQFVQVQRSQFINTVNLLRALGGSWLPADSDQKISL